MYCFEDYLEMQGEILAGIVDGMPPDERDAVLSDGLPIDAELIEGADLLRTIGGRAN